MKRIGEEEGAQSPSLSTKRVKVETHEQSEKRRERFRRHYYNSKSKDPEYLVRRREASKAWRLNHPEYVHVKKPMTEEQKEKNRINALQYYQIKRDEIIAKRKASIVPKVKTFKYLSVCN